MKALVKHMSDEEVEANHRVAYSLYEQFRPDVAQGAQGWGQHGNLKLDLVLR
jgi:hypothetical protein